MYVDKMLLAGQPAGIGRQRQKALVRSKYNHHQHAAKPHQWVRVRCGMQVREPYPATRPSLAADAEADSLDVLELCQPIFALLPPQPALLHAAKGSHLRSAGCGSSRDAEQCRARAIGNNHGFQAKYLQGHQQTPPALASSGPRGSAQLPLGPHLCCDGHLIDPHHPVLQPLSHLPRPRQVLQPGKRRQRGSGARSRAGQASSRPRRCRKDGMWGVRGRRGSAIESGCAAVCQLRCIALHANNVTSKHPPTHPPTRV